MSDAGASTRDLLEGSARTARRRKSKRGAAIDQATGQIDMEQAVSDPELRRRVHELAQKIYDSVPLVTDRTPEQRKFFLCMLSEFVHITRMAPASAAERQKQLVPIVAAMEWGIQMSGRFREEMKGFGFDPER